MWNKIVNPKTGRKVNLNSRIGKSVLRNYIAQLGGSKQTQLKRIAARINEPWKCKACDFPDNVGTRCSICGTPAPISGSSFY